MTDRQTDKHR